MSKKREKRVKAKKIAMKQQRNKKHAPPKWEDLATAAFSQIKLFNNLHSVVAAAVDGKKEEAEQELNRRAIAGFYKALNEHYKVIEALLKAHSVTQKDEDGNEVFVLLKDRVKYPLKNDKSFTTQVDYFEGAIFKDHLFKGYDLFSRYADETIGITGLLELHNTVLEMLGYVTEEDRKELLDRINIDAEDMKTTIDTAKVSVDANIAAVQAAESVIDTVNKVLDEEKTDGK